MVQHSYLWHDIETLHLLRNMQLEETQDEEEVAFADWLLDVGHGCGTAADSTSILPANMICADANALINTVYPDIQGRRPAPEYFL